MTLFLNSKITIKVLSNTKMEHRWSGPTTCTNKGSLHHKHSMDDSFFVRSPSLFSHTVSRRSQTPSPYLHRNHSRSPDIIDSNRRNTSRNGAISSSPTETPISSFSKLTSHNHSNTPFVSGDLSKSTSRRSTTPIIFSQSTTRKKPQHVEKRLECSLEELCFGGIKKIKITRDVISDIGIIVQEEETLHINVKPGWRKGTTIKFEGKGDNKLGYLPGDIVITIDEKKHPLFKRVGDDLELGVEVPFLKALVGCNITLPLLGGKNMFFRVDDVIYPGYEKVIQDQGMPKSNVCGQRGDLRLKFIVHFPLNLSKDKCIKVCNILETCF
ncbi:uncharacterized protein [Spinacia oleracea]|uniref:Uncharacterized protein isoform X2 n=1 Tax=Spinacia oleracea TaxID=3562 RepID=A0A9R0KAZ7_SPIOL|nr:uncharacterized protein LOC110803784 isoform X2 [Spinacia oleracea]